MTELQEAKQEIARLEEELATKDAALTKFGSVLDRRAELIRIASAALARGRYRHAT